MKEKIYIFGMGRMGITHMAIINGLFPDRFDFIVIEPDWKIRSLLKSNLKIEVVSDLDFNETENERVLITTPPFFHAEIVEKLIKSNAKTIFVEKPFGLFDKRVTPDDRISVGYVLRFGEIVQELKSLINEKGCKSIKISYNSNTITKKPTGWRNSKYGGVLNEMGSHIIDLLFFITGFKEFNINDISLLSVFSDNDDICKFKGTMGVINIEVSLNWVNKDYRKPVWSGELQTEESVVVFDQQSISSGVKYRDVDYYVRGRDFSAQMTDFILGSREIICNAKQANLVHDVIEKIKSND